jgi:hypothetical protein
MNTFPTDKKLAIVTFNDSHSFEGWQERKREEGTPVEIVSISNTPISKYVDDVERIYYIFTVVYTKDWD